MEYVVIWNNPKRSYSKKIKTLLEAKTFYEDLNDCEWKVLREIDGKVINFSEGAMI